MSKADIRWIQRFPPIGQSNEAAQERELSELEQQGMIQAFEFTHELAWNVLKDYVEEQGFVGSIRSRGVTREAINNGLLENDGAWMEMIDSRNKSSHTYNCATAEKIATVITSSYVLELEKFQKKFTELERRENH